MIKRRAVLTIALAMTLMSVMLMRSDSIVDAQNQVKPIADTGVIPLGPGQELRLTLLSGTPAASGNFNFRVRKTYYSEGTCTSGVCKPAVSSQSVSDLVTLAPGEIASIAVDPSDPNVIYVRAMVVSNSRDAQVKATIIDSATGAVVSFATTDLIIDVLGY